MDKTKKTAVGSPGFSPGGFPVFFGVPKFPSGSLEHFKFLLLIFFVSAIVPASF